MTPTSARAEYRRMMIKVGELVTVRRYSGTGGSRAVANSATALARVTGYDPNVLAGQMQQGDRHLIVLAEDLEVQSFPLPVTSNDYVVSRGKELSISVPDNATRSLAGTVVAYELIARGA